MTKISSVVVTESNHLQLAIQSDVIEIKKGVSAMTRGALEKTEEFDNKMARGLNQAQNKEGVPADEFFSSLREEILQLSKRDTDKDQQ